jgi:hypothetical protein
MLRRKLLLSLAAVLCLVGLEVGASTAPATPEAPCCCYDPTCAPGCSPDCPPDCVVPSCSGGSCCDDSCRPAEAKPKATVCPACPLCPAW